MSISVTILRQAGRQAGALSDALGLHRRILVTTEQLTHFPHSGVVLCLTQDLPACRWGLVLKRVHLLQHQVQETDRRGLDRVEGMTTLCTSACPTLSGQKAERDQSCLLLFKMQQTHSVSDWLSGLSIPTLDFGSGRDLMVHEFEPQVGLPVVSAEPASDPLPPSLSARPPFSLSLSKINKNNNNKKD